MLDRRPDSQTSFICYFGLIHSLPYVFSLNLNHSYHLVDASPPPFFFSGSDHATSPLSVWLHHILPAFLLLLLPVKIMVMRGKRSSWARILIPGSSRSLGLNSKVWIHDITCGAIICLLYWKPIPSPPPFFLENQHDRLGIFCPIRLYNVLHIELILL